MASNSPRRLRADDFLGTGWTFPPTFDRGRGQVVMSSDVDNIRQSLWVLLSTRLGERLMLATYGTDLWLKVFDGLTNTGVNALTDMISQAILNWEPRIKLLGVSVKSLDPIEGSISISIDFVVRTTNSRNNLVYPFYIQEGTLPPAPI